MELTATTIKKGLVIGRLCKCGCGKPTKISRGKPNAFIFGHTSRVKKLSEEQRRKMSEARRGENNPNAGNWWPYEKAEKFMIGVGLKNSNKAWKQYCKSGNKPDGIPSNPKRVYKGKGWVSWYKFLGIKKKNWLSFEEATEFLRPLKLKYTEWEQYCKSGKKPGNIPSHPERVYKDKWIGMHHFLGDKKQDWWSLEESKKYLQPLGLKSTEWEQYCKSGKKPDGIPAAPEHVYKDKGWKGMADFLDYEGIWDRKKVIETLRAMLPQIKEWHNYPSRLHTLLSANEKLNLSESNQYRQLVKNIVNVAQTEGGLAQIEEFLNSDSETTEIPSSLLGKEGEGKEEQELQRQTTEELEDSVKNYKGNGHDDEEILNYQQPRTPNDILNGALKMKFDNISIDDENYRHLINDNVKELWNSVYFYGIDRAVTEVKTGDKFRDEVASIFMNDYIQAVQLGENLPAGYSFKHQPKLMQLYVAQKIRETKSFLNLSGTGAGKTLSAVLASRTIESKMSLIVCPMKLVENKQWEDVIKSTFPDSVVITDMEYIIQGKLRYDQNKHQYVILNYDKFSLDYTARLIEEITKEKIDFVIFDEIQLVKARDKMEASKRHDNACALMTLVRQNNKDVRVLGMTATPVVNDLKEGKSLLELVTGKIYSDLVTKATASNAFALHQKLSLLSTRYMPKYNAQLNTKHIDIDIEQPADISIKELKNSPMLLEQFLLKGKIPEIIKNIDKKGQTIIYTEYVTDIVPKIAEAVRKEGYSYGYLTGEDSTGFYLFKNKKVQVLITSRPGAVGLDGLQDVCNKLIISALPWTNAQYQQLVGRIYREGQIKNNVDVVIIRATITKPINGKVYKFPYDPFLKWQRIVNKKTLADCAVDGRSPGDKRLATHTQVMNAAIEWIERLMRGEESLIERKDLNVRLTPSEIHQRISVFGEFSKMNKNINTEKSETTHERITKNPMWLVEYHRQMREAKKEWGGIIPVQVIADRILRMQAPRYMKKLVIGDFGCGEAELALLLPENKVHSFDHHNILAEDRITACDMKKTGLKNGELDVAVLSLSLMSINWIDYIKEARRCLTDKGYLIIAETTRSLDAHGSLYGNSEGRLYRLKDVLREEGFEILAEEQRGDFTFIEATKIN
jgi:superfamily II DNA or RNA helicase